MNERTNWTRVVCFSTCSRSRGRFRRSASAHDRAGNMHRAISTASRDSRSKPNPIISIEKIEKCTVRVRVQSKIDSTGRECSLECGTGGGASGGTCPTGSRKRRPHLVTWQLHTRKHMLH